MSFWFWSRGGRLGWARAGCPLEVLRRGDGRERRCRKIAPNLFQEKEPVWGMLATGPRIKFSHEAWC